MHAVTELLGDEAGRAFDPYSFREKMLAFCNRHHREKRALVFAFFIYDFNDPQIIKVLQDREYWAALNHISGRAITVFACNAPTPTDSRDEWALRLRSNLQSVFADVLGMQIRLHSPSILFFQVDDEEVIESFLATLDEKKVEDSFNEIRDIIERAAKALENVTEQNRGNVRDIFQLVEQDLSQRKLVKIIKKGIAVVKPLHAILKGIAHVFT